MLGRARWYLAAAGAVATALAGCAPGGAPEDEAAVELTVVDDIEARLAQYAPVSLTADLSALAPSEREALRLLVEASRPMDAIFLRQVWRGNPALRERLAAWEHPLAEPARAYFDINFGPWDRLDAMRRFVGDRPRPEGAGYYPEDLTREELEAYLAAHPDERERLVATTTVIRREGERLVAVPYSVEYRPFLEEAARGLRAAAAATTNDSLRRFLELRAEAFATDDYYESDKAWMDVDAAVEVTIGPYETYEDTLFGYKAAFESFVTVALPEDARALARYKELLPWLEANLPIPDEHKNPNRGTESPIRVVDEVFAAGDARAGVQTIAFNLPNDERVREEKGSKKVILRNVLRAKYETILLPIADRVLAPADRGRVAFEAFYAETLHHELAHGLGPGRIRKDGRETEVRLELKELYSTLEEAKADVMGVYDILALVERGEMPASLLEVLEPTYVAGLFRSARFGVHEAHGRGVVSQFNYLAEKGALVVDEEGFYRTEPAAFPGAIRDLLREMLLLQATGDYEGTRAFLEKYGAPTPALLAAIERLGDVPVDIRPVYATAEELLR